MQNRIFKTVGRYSNCGKDGGFVGYWEQSPRAYTFYNCTTWEETEFTPFTGGQVDKGAEIEHENLKMVFGGIQKAIDGGGDIGQMPKVVFDKVASGVACQDQHVPISYDLTLHSSIGFCSGSWCIGTTEWGTAGSDKRIKEAAGIDITEVTDPKEIEIAKAFLAKVYAANKNLDSTMQAALDKYNRFFGHLEKRNAISQNNIEYFI